MLQENPQDRETCDNLIKHPLFMDDERRWEIVEKIAERSSNNQYLTKIMDKNELHLEGFLGTNSDAWKKLLKHSIFSQIEKDYTTCSRLLQLFKDYEVLKLL